MGAGHLLTLDYGLADNEWLRPERIDGTLRAYRQHQASSDVLAEPGSRDLTAHVNFAAIRQAGEAAGLRTEYLTTQSQFLMGILRGDSACMPTARRGRPGLPGN